MEQKLKWKVPQLRTHGTVEDITHWSGDSAGVDTFYLSGYRSGTFEGKGSSDWGSDPCYIVDSGSCPE